MIACNVFVSVARNIFAVSPFSTSVPMYEQGLIRNSVHDLGFIGWYSNSEEKNYFENAINPIGLCDLGTRTKQKKRMQVQSVPQSICAPLATATYFSSQGSLEFIGNACHPSIIYNRQAMFIQTAQWTAFPDKEERQVALLKSYHPSYSARSIYFFVP